MTTWIRAHWPRLAAGLALGLAGTLIRADFVLLPLCLLAMQIALWQRRISSAGSVRRAGGLGGVVAEEGDLDVAESFGAGGTDQN